MDLVNEYKNAVEKAISHLKEDLKSIRTGRATPAILENLQIEAYGGTTKMSLSSLATISTHGPSVLQVVPFDQSIIQEIEKAILTSPLGLSPKVQSNMIIATVPPLSEEQREKFVKIVGQKIEEKKNIVRGARDDVRRKIKNKQENKEITEDERFRLEKEVENATSDLIEEIQNIKDKKEEEIRQV